MTTRANAIFLTPFTAEAAVNGVKKIAFALVVIAVLCSVGDDPPELPELPEEAAAAL
eukprot:NODE_18107_length_172_cov_0.829268_g16337_i0.p2 GENE.NODE_18107_length_172_cov_0.829268_g16337_i0~~NODE_18107_length_172_cov_0.829268_g16337_i0.p2  ORF type:complete len:57 (-),score=30.47 NODE_18107_length_172_cov_0.829268_g16337_i0:2-172(-)